MEGKICRKCGEFKSYSEFNKAKSCKDGYRGECIQCRREGYKQYYYSHKEEKQEYYKQYYVNNKDDLNEYHKQYSNSHKEKIKGIFKKYNNSHKEERKQYYESHKNKNIMKINEIIKNIEKFNLINKYDIPIYGYIYKIENIKTGRIYIGQTIQSLTRRYKSNIIEAWKNERLKYDTQKFKDELINIDDFKLTEILDVGICKYHLDKLEAYYINLYDSYNNGYNNKNGNHITDDGIGEFKEILEYYNINESELIWRG